MHLITVSKLPQHWALAKDISLIFGYKSPTKLLAGFRQFCDTRPNYFKPMLPYRALDGSDTMYNILCVAHYFEYKALLDAGTRSIKFKDDLPRLREAYGLHLLREEVV